MQKAAIPFLLLVMVFGSCSPANEDRPFQVIPHPDGSLYAGDRVSFEVIPGDVVTDRLSVQVSEGGTVIGTSGFGPYGVGGRNEAVLLWSWDTIGLKPGQHTLTFTILPGGETWTEQYNLHSAGDAPSPEANWTYTASDCCMICYVTGTEAERDIETIKQIVDEQADDVERDLGMDFIGPAPITLLPRTLGHGGFTSDGVYVSYLDRNYAGSTTDQVMHHELAHLLDVQIGGLYRPSILVEGLAVYVSGGHFKHEALLPRAAALFELGWYVPLETLSNDFYHQQHEVGYLEAGAFIQYLVERYGWSAFDDFYRSMPFPENYTPSGAIDRHMQEKFGITMAEMESGFTARLQTEVVTSDVREDLQLTVAFYDTVRRYQQGLDPSAYFLTAWLPDGMMMRLEGIVADYVRRPDSWKNRQIESMLVSADEELRAGDYQGAENKLERINWMLGILVP
jgi:hypothetical protein